MDIDELEDENNQLKDENNKLRKLIRDIWDMAYPEAPSAFNEAFDDRMRELGIEVDKKPCPFCGSIDLCVSIGIYAGERQESVTITCNECGASMWGFTKERAIAKWNRRMGEEDK